MRAPRRGGRPGRAGSGAPGFPVGPGGFRFRVLGGRATSVGRWARSAAMEKLRRVLSGQDDEEQGLTAQVGAGPARGRGRAARPSAAGGLPAPGGLGRQALGVRRRLRHAPSAAVRPALPCAPRRVLGGGCSPARSRRAPCAGHRSRRRGAVRRKEGLPRGSCRKRDLKTSCPHPRGLDKVTSSVELKIGAKLPPKCFLCVAC